jgi:hypothetical protein
MFGDMQSGVCAGVARAPGSPRSEAEGRSIPEEGHRHPPLPPLQEVSAVRRLDEIAGADEEEAEGGAEEADDRADHEDRVEAADEGDVGGVHRLGMDGRWQAKFGDGARTAGGDGLAQTVGGVGKQLAQLRVDLPLEDRPQSGGRWC